MIAFKCPTCGKEYAVKDESGGKKTTCRVCKTRMVIPDAVGLPTSAGVAPGAGNDQAVPGKVRAIPYMVLAGGIFALFWFFVECLLSLAFCFCFIPGIYSLIVGLVATIKGAQLLAANRYRHPPPTLGSARHRLPDPRVR